MNGHRTLPVISSRSLEQSLPAEGLAIGDMLAVGDLEVRVHPGSNGDLRIGLHGELDGHTAELLDAILVAATEYRLPESATHTVTFDLAGVEFVYMRGIAVLQQVCESLTGQGWRISMTNARPHVADLLAIARQHHSLMLTEPVNGLRS